MATWMSISLHVYLHYCTICIGNKCSFVTSLKWVTPMSYLAGGMYFLAMPSCLLSTKFSWEDDQTTCINRTVCLHLQMTGLSLHQTQRPPLVLPRLPRGCPSACWGSRSPAALQERTGNGKMVVIWQLWYMNDVTRGGVDQDLSNSDMRDPPMSSWMVTRSSTLNEVSSFRGWLHRWHTKLTCMVVVLLEDLEPSIATPQTHHDTGERQPRGHRAGAAGREQVFGHCVVITKTETKTILRLSHDVAAYLNHILQDIDVNIDFTWLNLFSYLETSLPSDFLVDVYPGCDVDVTSLWRLMRASLQHNIVKPEIT